ncbi:MULTISPECIES: NmrA family NAD(P)-binding protein [unclassified Cryobacterium]|uniref:NmrA family NAD(P)-binding protein n=1 Tax=unclassified Cryobacterium TaxID=2649013 RepID=UPI00106D5E96|nr:MULTISPECIES: NmrA family NAD(P)-binding protein [unclassified Cryobacterium]TFC50314.1 NAD-dependent epimerase/dehydratase family protein [Cryobacterium sp. TMB3-1-2]TFC71952.1 NAD-dependent epimerase/dehydratase family protein [Cryobacterium sp. TMB3-15]TFC78545.1 NAD-dependent epimerase/dehydratase family protein [Cryobacterium sp. TMB3-10]TFD44602.1 NAD-dependent epimerase/dehydratase family protein [Cryobacterium sp. TMB3-12]
MTTSVLVAGATGDLGQRIVRELLTHDTRIRVLTRPGSASAAGLYAANDRVDIVTAEYTDHAALTQAVSASDVVVSAVSGTRPVIVDAQRALLAAAVAAGVPRFIPSDYSSDYRQIALGTNRNFELRREFAADLDAAPIKVTSVLNGAFADMLTGTAPMIAFGRRKVMYWSSADQILDFTTKDDVARVVALVALDPDSPRVVEIAGDRVTARSVAQTMSELTGTKFTLQWAGTTGTLSAMAKGVRRLSKSEDATFPAWQGMQYFVSMFSGQAQLHHVDNDRYGVHAWTSVRDVLAAHLASQPEVAAATGK